MRLFLAILIIPAIILGQDYLDNVNRFEAGRYRCGGLTLPYRLYSPDIDESSALYPMLLALHGAGGRGTDNTRQIAGYRIILELADSVNAALTPSFILAPQSPFAASWETPSVKTCVMNLIDSLVQHAPVDSNRIYMTGFSMGGIGVYALALTYPDRFAAIVPCCGRGDTHLANRILHLPIWMHHGSLDASIAVENSRKMAGAFASYGRYCLFTHYDYRKPFDDFLTLSDLETEIEQGAECLFSEYQDRDHGDLCGPFQHPLLYKWLFMQKRSDFTSVPVLQISCPNLMVGKARPNPFNPVTVVPFRIKKSGWVKIYVYNALGEIVTGPEVLYCREGDYTREFYGSGLTSGLYFFSFETEEVRIVRKLLLLQ